MIMSTHYIYTFEYVRLSSVVSLNNWLGVGGGEEKAIFIYACDYPQETVDFKGS